MAMRSHDAFNHSVFFKNVRKVKAGFDLVFEGSLKVIYNQRITQRDFSNP